MPLSVVSASRAVEEFCLGCWREVKPPWGRKGGEHWGMGGRANGSSKLNDGAGFGPCKGCDGVRLGSGSERLGVGSIRKQSWSSGAAAPGLDEWLPVYPPFRASWQMASRSYPRFLRPLYSFRMAGFPQSGWKPALSSCALPKPVQASFDAGAAVHPFLAISYPGVWNGGCTHRPLAQRGLSCPRLQSLRQAPNFPR